MTSETFTSTSETPALLPADFAVYLLEHDWTEISHPNSRLRLFRASATIGTDDQGQPIQLVLPSKEGYEDAARLVEKALRLLSMLQSKSVQAVKEVILEFGRSQSPTEQTQEVSA